jgi:hypothetical protein
MTDASHGNEFQVTGDGTLEPHRSQQGRLTMIAEADILSKGKGAAHVIGFSSTVIRRVCRSTMQAETYSLQNGVEEGLRIRAAITDMFGQLDIHNWEQTSARFMRHVWLTDCKSLEEHLKNPTFNRCSDKRLSIDLAALRQLLWTDGNGGLLDELNDDCQDVVQWIDTTAMAADVLTKSMRPDRLLELLATSQLDLTSIRIPASRVLSEKRHGCELYLLSCASLNSFLLLRVLVRDCSVSAAVLTPKGAP